MKSKLSRSKSIDLYRRLTLLIFFGLFVILTLVVIIIYSLGNGDTSTGIGKTQQFILNLYPNIFIILSTLLCSYLFFRPISKADQDEQEDQFLEKMRNIVLPVLEEKFAEKTRELLVPMVQTTLTHVLQDSASIQEMGVTGMKPRVNYGELRDRIARSKDRVYVSDTWILNQINELEDALKQTALYQVPVHVLLLDPKSSVAKQRLIDLYGDNEQSDHLFSLSMAKITACYKKNSLENLEVRLHSTMPAMQIFICDNKATTGFYLHGQDSLILTQLEVLIKNEKGDYTPFGKQIEYEFETRWNLATPVQL